MHEQCLAVRQDEALAYPQQVPYDAGTSYAEWPAMPVSSEKNAVYENLRACFADLGLDAAHQGTPQWNPFSDFVIPGNTVVIKPNLVLDTNNPAIQECTTTHPSLLRVLVDYTWKALAGSGEIVVGDAPGAEANFEEIVRRSGLREMIEILRQRGINVRLEDFRAVRVKTENGVWTGEQTVAGTPTSQIVALGRDSLFACERYAHAKLHGAGYNIQETNRHHKGKRQEYSVSKTILQADVVISVPKFKTHRKAGITCCLKNLVGINTDKNYLPHFAMGAANMGGDETPGIEKKNVWRVRSYNWAREHIISHTWRFLGGPGAKMLRFLRGREIEKPIQTAVQPTGEKAPVPQSNAPQAVSKDTDLAKWLHNKLSGQPVAAGAWAGNETICRMILDLNHIFLCCGRDGILQKNTDRKYFYVVDAVKIGMGDGPTHPVPAEAQVVAAGWNGLAIDTALLALLKVRADAITLYQMANRQAWMHTDEDGVKYFNGRQLTEQDKLPLTLLPPTGWMYENMSD